MSASHSSSQSQLQLPRSQTWGPDQQHFVPAPSYESFTSNFGNAFPKPQFIHSDIGATAVYNLAPPSGQSKRHILFIHGANTPALGMLPLSRALQAKDPDAHIVLYDLWGHGLSSTPLVAHSRHIFHHQALQVLGFMRWTAAHLVGFSFGGIIAPTFATLNPWMVLSVALIAPAGLMRFSDNPPEMQHHLRNPEGNDAEAARVVLEWLEDGQIVVPQGWKEQMASGEVVVAEALRKWELDHHQGYSRSVLSMVREGGLFDSANLFRAFTKTGTKTVGILGGEDDICSKQQLLDVGFRDIHEVKQAGHGVPRTHVTEVAPIIHAFWQGL